PSETGGEDARLQRAHDISASRAGTSATSSTTASTNAAADGSSDVSVTQQVHMPSDFAGCVSRSSESPTNPGRAAATFNARSAWWKIAGSGLATPTRCESTTTDRCGAYPHSSQMVAALPHALDTSPSLNPRDARVASMCRLATETVST